MRTASKLRRQIRNARNIYCQALANDMGDVSRSAYQSMRTAQRELSQLTGGRQTTA